VSRLRMALARLRGVLSGGRGESRTLAEIETHLSMLAAEFERHGMTAAEAKLAARRQFGGVTQVREECRRTRGLPWLETLAQDLWYACRQLQQRPGFAAAAILTLALGIGANTAIYQVLYAVVFRPLPVPQPEQLVELQVVRNNSPQRFSYPLFQEMAARQNVLDGIFAVSEFPLSQATLRGRGPARPIRGALVTGDYFRVLRVAPRLGHVFTTDDDRGAAPVAVIADRFWDAEFDRSPSVLGQTLDINQVAVTIIGVAPHDFFGETVGQTPDVWLPMGLEPRLTPSDYLNAPYFTWLAVLGRLRSDVPLRQAQASLDALYQHHSNLTITMAGPPAHLELRPAGRGINELRQFADPLTVLMALVGLVLLIASSNLANLLLSRATARTHEIGVRLALGAGRGRLVRQLLTESLVLSAIGAALALLLARWGSRALVVLAGQRISLASGWAASGFTAAVALAVTCIFGIAPALAAARVDLHAALQANRRAQSADRQHQWLGKTLVTAQISLSLLLVTSAGMLVRTLWNLRHQGVGFEPDQVLQASLPLEIGRTTIHRSAAIRQPLYQRLNALPGIRAAALSCCGPFSSIKLTSRFSAPARPSQQSDDARIVHVSPGYFSIMAPILSGRPITADDRQGSPLVAVLSQTAARKLFGARNPVGAFISEGNQFDAGHQLLVVGVAQDVRYALREPYGFFVYVPLAQGPAPITDIELRATGDPARLAAEVRTAIQSIDPNLRIGDIRLLRAAIEAGLTQERMMAWLSACFGALALLLTFIGVYGVIGYAAERRIQEIGIRLALGARRGQITRLIFKDLGLWLATGVLLGGAASLAASRALHKLLFGIGSIDWTMPAAALSIILVSAAAGWLPARRAAALDPTEALRQE
jgi:predicted permease